MPYRQKRNPLLDSRKIFSKTVESDSSTGTLNFDSLVIGPN